jgi:hypothetical protein
MINGYFGSLMRMTGLAKAGDGRFPAAVSPAVSWAVPGKSGTAGPIHVETTTVVQSPTTQTGISQGEPSPAGPRAGFPWTAADHPGSPVEQNRGSAEQRKVQDTEIKEHPFKAPLEIEEQVETRVLPQDLPVEPAEENRVTDNPQRYSPEAVEINSEVHLEESENQGVTIEEVELKEIVDRPAGKPGIEVESSRENNVRRTLKAVRAWVAETGTAGMDTLDAAHLVQPTTAKAAAPEQRLSSFVNRIPGEDSAGLNEFNLSIGTINVSIEDPQPQAREQNVLTDRLPQQQLRRQRGRSEAPSSRLSRHYIRMRG